jgi:hypothetical protein
LAVEQLQGVLLGMTLCKQRGYVHSRFKPTWICVLIGVQGGNIMLGGISFQLAIICFYAIFMVEFFVRWWKDKPVGKQWKLRRDAKSESQYHQRSEASGKMKIMITALVFASLCLFIR